MSARLASNLVFFWPMPLQKVITDVLPDIHACPGRGLHVSDHKKHHNIANTIGREAMHPIMRELLCWKDMPVERCVLKHAMLFKRKAYGLLPELEIAFRISKLMRSKPLDGSSDFITG